MAGRKPTQMMVHCLDHYRATHGMDADGGRTLTFALYRENVPCMVQPPTSDILEEYRQRDERIKAVAWLDTVEYYNEIALADQLLFKGTKYKVAGKANLCFLDRAFRLDLVEDISGV